MSHVYLTLTFRCLPGIGVDPIVHLFHLQTHVICIGTEAAFQVQSLSLTQWMVVMMLQARTSMARGIRQS